MVICGSGASWIIDKVVNGVLANEFNNLYAALFNNPHKHIEVIRALSRKNKGLTRSEILKTSKLLTGGGATTVLNELTESGFIQKIYPFGKKEKDSLFRLVDEFSLFYLKFMQKREGDSYLKTEWFFARLQMRIKLYFLHSSLHTEFWKMTININVSMQKLQCSHCLHEIGPLQRSEGI